MESFKQKMLSGILWRALNVVVAFFLNAFLVRQMGASSSGSFYYLLNNLFFGVLFLSISLESGISFYNARKELSESFLFSISVVWSILGSIVFFIVITLIPQPLVQTGQRYIFFSLYLFGAMLTTFLSAIYFTNHNSKIPNLVVTIINLMLILILPKMPWMQDSINFETYTTLYLCSPLLSSAVMALMLLQKRLHFSLSLFKVKVIKPLVVFSFHSFLLALLFNLLKRSDFWLVTRWCTASDTGNYFQASKVVQLLLLLPAMASFSLYPLIVESIKKNEPDKSNTETAKMVLRLSGVYFVLAFLISLLVLASGYWVFPFLYGNSFSDLYFITIFLVPGLICFAGTFPITIFFSGKNQNITVVFFLSISLASLLISNFILTPRYFVYGAAISNSVANIVYFVLLLRKFIRQNKLPFNVEFLGSLFKIINIKTVFHI